jgi:Fe-S cluster biosynthesis and repair protein YggX
MTHTVHCVKLQKEAEGLPRAPYPGELGKKIHAHISKEAWGMWLAQQTMLINEYRLNLADRESQAFLATEMEKFLFGQGAATPPGYVSPEK